MLKRLSIENFTVFSKASFEFAAGLNVIVGENGTGKSHVLKLAYAVLAENHAQGKSKTDFENAQPILERRYAEKLVGVFRANRGGFEKLVRRGQNYQQKRHDVNEWIKRRLHILLAFDEEDLDCAFGYQTVFGSPLSGIDVSISHLPKQWIMQQPIFIPSRELLTLYPGFISLYETRFLEFEETYYDTCLRLGEPLLKKPMMDLLSALEEAMGGKVELDRDRFYLVTPEQGKMEMPMVAEGIRKLAMLAQLVAVGALQKDGYLFWDEPEANLNPRLIKVVARVILQLAKAGIQIFIATHSYFLLKELDILTIEQPIPTRYFSLLKGEDGVVVESGDSLDDLQTIVALDEELAQFDREQDAHHA